MEGIFFVNFSLSASFLGLVGRRPDLLSVSPAARLGHGVVRTRPREVAAQMPRWARDGYFSSIVQTGRKIPRMCEEVHSLSAGQRVFFCCKRSPRFGSGQGGGPMKRPILTQWIEGAEARSVWLLAAENHPGRASLAAARNVSCSSVLARIRQQLCLAETARRLIPFHRVRAAN